MQGIPNTCWYHCLSEKIFWYFLTFYDPTVSEPWTAPASSLVISVPSVSHPCRNIHMEGCFLFLFLTSQKGRCTWSPLFLVCLDGLVPFLPSLLHRLRAVCRPEQGKVGSWASLPQLSAHSWLFCMQTWSLYEEDSYGHKTCNVRKPEVSNIYCNDLSIRPPSGGAGPEEFLSLVALSYIFLFTQKIVAGLSQYVTGRRIVLPSRERLTVDRKPEDEATTHCPSPKDNSC